MGDYCTFGPVAVSGKLVPVPHSLAKRLRINVCTDEVVDRALELVAGGKEDLLESARVFALLAHDVEAASRFLVTHVLRRSGCRRCTLFVAESDFMLALAAYSGVPLRLVNYIERLRPDRGVIGWVYNHGVPLLVRDVSRIKLPGLNPERYSSRSFASVPIRNEDGKIIGVVNVTDPVGRSSLTPEQLVQISSAVEHAAPIVAQAWRSYQLTRLSYLDPLTSLFNRRFLQVALDHYLEAASRGCFPVSLLVVDVDHFKQINDRYGHQIGDEVLCLIADLLRYHFRDQDLVCRLGGEEFAIIMPRRRRSGKPDAPAAQETEAVEFAERLRSAVEAYSLEGILGEPAGVTVSCGIATFPQDALDAQQLLTRADEALYQAKRKGRNRVETYCPLYRASLADRDS